jgi:hypothetical protein
VDFREFSSKFWGRTCNFDLHMTNVNLGTTNVDFNHEAVMGMQIILKEDSLMNLTLVPHQKRPVDLTGLGLCPTKDIDRETP